MRRLLCSLLILCAVGSMSAEERPAWSTSRITGTPEPPHAYRLAPAFPKLKFERPTSIEVFGPDRLLVTEMGGNIYTFATDSQTSTKDLLVDLKSLLPKQLAGRGVSLFDAELHPKFAENRFLFVCYMHPGGERQEQSECESAHIGRDRRAGAGDLTVFDEPRGLPRGAFKRPRG